MPFLNFESERAMCYNSRYSTYCFEGGDIDNLISINIDTGLKTRTISGRISCE